MDEKDFQTGEDLLPDPAVEVPVVCEALHGLLDDGVGRRSGAGSKQALLFRG
jgi:hypothetical protein